MWQVQGPGVASQDDPCCSSSHSLRKIVLPAAHAPACATCQVFMWVAGGILQSQDGLLTHTLSAAHDAVRCVPVGVACCRFVSLMTMAAAGGRCPCIQRCMLRTSGESTTHPVPHNSRGRDGIGCLRKQQQPRYESAAAVATFACRCLLGWLAVVPGVWWCKQCQPTSTAVCHGATIVRCCRIEPDGQRPKVLIHGKACRKTANPKCAYDTSDTRSGIEVRAAGCASAYWLQPVVESVHHSLDVSDAAGHGERWQHVGLCLQA